MTPAMQRVVYEAYPELAFRSITGRPMTCNKKTRQGQRERIAALRSLGPSGRQLDDILARASADVPRSHVALDDLLDAFVLVETARRIFSRQALCLPPDAPVGRKGLRMEIWY